MALVINSNELFDRYRAGSLDRNLIHAAYNALDSAVTLRVHQKLALVLANDPLAQGSYSFVRAMQAPALDMMLRGIMIQQKVRQDETERYLRIREKAQGLLDELANAVWGPVPVIVKDKTHEIFTPIGKRGQPLTPRQRVVVVERLELRPRGLNPNSSKQVLEFFNQALRFPVEYEIRKTATGSERTPTANDKALRKWARARTKGPGIDPRDRTVSPVRIAAPFVSLILTIRDADKMLQVLRTPLDPDGRMRCSYNPVGTENARWSSSSNAFGRGTNLQNITPSMRRMFCADDGYRLVSTDLEQAESYIVAGLVWAITGDRTYLNAILSGDLHTQVCIMAWPEKEWTNDLKANRAIAEGGYPDLHHLSYRDVSKRIGHGSNYDGSAYGIAQAVGIPVHIVEEFQRRYFRAFAAIREYHRWVKTTLRNEQCLVTPLGRRRHFFGRPEDPSTQREAIAYIPQSTVGELLNLIMWKCWRRTIQPNPNPLPIQLLLQNHDAFLFQIPLSQPLGQVIDEVNHEFQSIPITFVRGDEQLAITIPGEFVTGYNWAYKDKSPSQVDRTFVDGNPDGLEKWKGSDTRSRTQSAKVTAADWLTRGPISRIF